MKVKTIIALIPALFLLIVSSCDTIEYKTFEQKEGYDHYSFEYPADYQLTANSAFNFQPAANILTIEKKLDDGSNIVLKLSTGELSTEYTNSIAAAEAYINIIAAEIRERSTATINGIPGMVFTVEMLSGVQTPYIMKEFVFDYNQRSWNFNVTAYNNHTRQIDKVFKHVLDTFKLFP